jgi:bacteriocin-like protein
MRTFNLNGIEVLSNQELACVKGGEGVPVPIIIVETSVAAPTTTTLSVLVAAPVTTTTTKKSK